MTAVTNYEQKNTMTSGKPIKAVYASYVYVYVFCTSQSGRLGYNSVFVGLGGWGVKDNDRIIYCTERIYSVFVFFLFVCFWHDSPQ